jgi:hypothetical protein
MRQGALLEKYFLRAAPEMAAIRDARSRAIGPPDVLGVDDDVAPRRRQKKGETKDGWSA